MIGAITNQRKALVKLLAPLGCLLILAMAFNINTHVARLAIVSGESMYPTFMDKDILLVNQVNYIPSRGDVILIDISGRSLPGRYIVKRIIAVSEDTVTLDYEKNTVYVNGIMISEPYLNLNQSDPMLALDDVNNITYQVPVGTVFVMGDNRNNSLDSRNNMLGMINVSDVVGEVCKRFSFLQYFN